MIALPHLGASTAEAEENCAVMVADDLREFLEHGNLGARRELPRACACRVRAALRLAISRNRNVPNMVAQILTALAAQQINIAEMLNHSRGELPTRSWISTRRRTKPRSRGFEPSRAFSRRE